MSFQGAILDPRYTVQQDQWLSGIQARSIHFDRFVAPHAGFSASELCTAASPIIDMTQGYAGYREDSKDVVATC